MYRYKEIKPCLFSDEGQRMFLKVRDFVHQTLSKAGAIRMQEAMGAAGTGDTWAMMACVDRLVELGEIREVCQANLMVVGQDRIFVAAK